jgi:hypothetical protein
MLPPGTALAQHVAHACCACIACVGVVQDVVLLQEVWVDADAQLLIKAGRAAGLTHATHFR